MWWYVVTNEAGEGRGKGTRGLDRRICGILWCAELDDRSTASQAETGGFLWL